MRRFAGNLVSMVVWSVLSINAAHATGGMSSGGGDLPSDRDNPWWVDNTRSVSYCIAIDADHFGTSLAEARRRIVGALSYWKGEFAHTDFASTPSWSILRDRSLSSRTAESTTDLRFQLGVLTGEQSGTLEHKDMLIGEAVRMRYDSAQLHGQGFVYISPESGPLALKDKGGWGPFVPQRWSVADG